LGAHRGDFGVQVRELGAHGGHVGVQVGNFGLQAGKLGAERGRFGAQGFEREIGHRQDDHVGRGMTSGLLAHLFSRKGRFH
jgi:hypothetical protein